MALEFGMAVADNTKGQNLSTIWDAKQMVINVYYNMVSKYSDFLLHIGIGDLSYQMHELRAAILAYYQSFVQVEFNAYLLNKEKFNVEFAGYHDKDVLRLTPRDYQELPPQMFSDKVDAFSDRRFINTKKLLLMHMVLTHWSLKHGAFKLYERGANPHVAFSEG